MNNAMHGIKSVMTVESVIYYVMIIHHYIITKLGFAMELEFLEIFKAKAVKNDILFCKTPF